MYLYILRNSKFAFKIKIGIANNVERRKREIEESTSGKVTVIAKFRCTSRKDALRKEQFLHEVFKPFNSRTKGTGKTEYFWGFGFSSIIAVIWIGIMSQILPIILILMALLIYSKF